MGLGCGKNFGDRKDTSVGLTTVIMSLTRDKGLFLELEFRDWPMI